MIRIEKTFKTGYIRPLGRGIILGEDEDNDYLADLIEDAVGENCSHSGATLTNIRLVIKIEKATLDSKETGAVSR